MEIANIIPVPPPPFYLDTIFRSFYGKKSQYDTFVGQIMFVTMKFQYSGRQ